MPQNIIKYDTRIAVIALEIVTLNLDVKSVSNDINK